MSSLRVRSMKIIAIIAFIVTLHYSNLVNSAAVPFERRLQESGNVRTLRSAEESMDMGEPKRSCYNLPCGWAVYNTYTRDHEYYMKNVCECPDESYKCVRVGDDLSASAYVYRCRQNTTSSDIESPSEESF